MLLRVIAKAACWLTAALLICVPSAAQPVPAPGWAQPPPPPLPMSTYTPSTTRRGGPASSFEMGTLYAASTAYGIGMGVWLDAELSLDDPAILLIPPTLLGVAAPVGAYFMNRPSLPRGVPGAISAGLVIGAGEGLGIASLQMISSNEPWGLTGLARAMLLGSSIGGIAGYAVGVVQEPSPNISAFATSGVFWGSLIGSLVGLGSSDEGAGFSRSNDWMARGGLIGFNAGLAASMGLSTVFVPTIDQLSWMWLGGGIGALASLPVYLFYVGEGGPPAKRGLLFTATATGLGIVAGGVFGPSLGGLGLGRRASEWASIDAVTPLALPGGMGVQIAGSLF
jgi:hypothetical protein